MSQGELPETTVVGSDSSKLEIVNRLSISCTTNLVSFFYDKVEKIVVGNPPEWNNFFRLLIVCPTHLVPSLYNKVKNLVIGNPLGHL